MKQDNDERLKASAGISRTLNLGSFRSYRIQLSVEFYPEEHTHEEVVHVRAVSVMTGYPFETSQSAA